MISDWDKSKVDELMDFWLKNIKNSYDFIDGTYWEGLYEGFKNNYILDSETYVYEEDQKLIAFVSIIEEGNIIAFFVDKDQQDRGVGSELLNFIKEKYDQLDISIYKQNTIARTFFANEGFRILYEQNDVNTGEAEYFMRWRKDDL